MFSPKMLGRAVMPAVVGLLAFMATPVALADDPSALADGIDLSGLTEVTTSDGFTRYVASANYYKQFTYDWIDDDGNTITSRITERAEEPNQIAALVRAIYSNRYIPGYIEDIAYAKHLKGIAPYANASYITEVGSNEYALPYLVNPNDTENPQMAKEERESTRAEWYKVRYGDCNPTNGSLSGDYSGYPWNIVAPEGEDFTPYYSGATALLVEMSDDYTKAGKNDEYGTNEGICGYDSKKPWMNAFNFIKSVTLITSQIYVSEDDGSTNPGFLFNIEADLSKCFIITKGSIRPYKDNHQLLHGDLGLKQGQTLFEGYPFYNMFEEFSPTNSGPMYDAYKQMNSGVAFPVDHNCSSVIEQQHDIVFGAEANEDQDFAINLMFHLPDYRFAGESRKASEDATKAYGVYTYYAKDHQPYIFFSKIKATISNPVVDNANDHYAWVPVEWTSNYKNIVKQQSSETFEIHRVSGGIVNPDPIKWDEIDILDENTTKGETDGEIVRSIDATVKIRVREQRDDREASDVTYVIYGKRTGSDFALVESNLVDTEILNAGTGMLINLRKAWASDDAKNEDAGNYNWYANIGEIYYNNNPETNAGNLKIQDLTWHSTFPEYPTSTLTLTRQSVRVEDGKETKGIEEPIATIKIENPEKDVMAYVWGTLNGDGKTPNPYDGSHKKIAYCYRFTIRSIETGNVMGHLFYKGDRTQVTEDPSKPLAFNGAANGPYCSKYVYVENDGETIGYQTADWKEYTTFPDDAPDGNSYKLGEFKDEFNECTADGMQPDKYIYNINVTSAYTGKDVRSNNFVVNVPRRPILIGYMPHSQSDIEGDVDYHSPERLKVNEPGARFLVRNNVNIEGYTITRIRKDAEGNEVHTKVARAERINSGAFDRYYTRKNGKEAQMERTEAKFDGYMPMQIEDVQPNDEFRLTIRYVDHEHAVEDNPYVLNSGTGNRYGGRRALLSTLPTVKINKVQITYEGASSEPTKPYHYSVKVSVDANNLDYTHHSTDEGYTYNVVGYGLWSHIYTDYKKGDPMFKDGQRFDFISGFHPYDQANGIMPASVEWSNGAVGSEDERTFTYEFDSDRLASAANPVAITHVARLYAQIDPETNLSGAADNGYVIADTQGLHGVFSTNPDAPTTGVEGVTVEAEEVAPEYYNLQGRRIDADNLTPGIYVVRRGAVVTKELIR